MPARLTTTALTKHCSCSSMTSNREFIWVLATRGGVSAGQDVCNLATTLVADLDVSSYMNGGDELAIRLVADTGVNTNHCQDAGANPTGASIWVAVTITGCTDVRIISTCAEGCGTSYAAGTLSPC